jgi:hypothetical protein
MVFDQVVGFLTHLGVIAEGLNADVRRPCRRVLRSFGVASARGERVDYEGAEAMEVRDHFCVGASARWR